MLFLPLAYFPFGCYLSIDYLSLYDRGLEYFCNKKVVVASRDKKAIIFHFFQGDNKNDIYFGVELVREM